MDPLDAIKAMTDAMTEAWAKGPQAFAGQALAGQAFASSPDAPFSAWAAEIAKVTLGEAAAGGAPSPPIGPEFQAFERARQAFATAMGAAMNLSASVAGSLKTASGEPDPETAKIQAEILAKIFDPAGWFGPAGRGPAQMNEGLAGLAEGPGLADLRTIERRSAAVGLAWLVLRRCQLEHDTLILEAWSKAATLFAAKLEGEPEAGEDAQSWRSLMDGWVETANAALMEHQRSEAGLTSQRNLLRAATDLKLAQRALAETYSEMLGLPTRAEMDEAHRNITELRRELRALKRHLRERGDQPS